MWYYCIDPCCCQQLGQVAHVTQTEASFKLPLLINLCCVIGLTFQLDIWRTFWTPPKTSLRMRGQWSWKPTSDYHLLMKRVLKEAKLRLPAETRKLTCISSLWSRKMAGYMNWVSLWLSNISHPLFSRKKKTKIQIVFLTFNYFDCG